MVTLKSPKGITTPRCPGWDLFGHRGADMKMPTERRARLLQGESQAHSVSEAEIWARDPQSAFQTQVGD